jgi:hypothetical protein
LIDHFVGVIELASHWKRSLHWQTAISPASLYWVVIVRKSISFPKDVEDRLIEYRKSRKPEVGKMMPRSTAITELLRVALTNLEPPKPIEERIDDAGRDFGTFDCSSDKRI